MNWPHRYLVISVFFLLVFIILFFIYQAALSPERVVNFESTPSDYQKVKCILGGGKIEKTLIVGALNLEETEPLTTDKFYSCHYH